MVQLSEKANLHIWVFILSLLLLCSSHSYSSLGCHPNITTWSSEAPARIGCRAANHLQQLPLGMRSSISWWEIPSQQSSGTILVWGLVSRSKGEKLLWYRQSPSTDFVSFFSGSQSQICVVVWKHLDSVFDRRAWQHNYAVIGGKLLETKSYMLCIMLVTKILTYDQISLVRQI